MPVRGFAAGFRRPGRNTTAIGVTGGDPRSSADPLAVAPQPAERFLPLLTPRAMPSAFPLVAVVDDHSSFRTAANRVLQGAGFATEAFASVQQLIESGALRRASCLLLDIHMPGIDGLSLMECLQATNFRCPVVFCSGVEDDAIAEQVRLQGAAGFLRKPVDAEQLVRAVRDACALRA